MVFDGGEKVVRSGRGEVQWSAYPSRFMNSLIVAITSTVLAVSEDGAIWSVIDGALSKQATLPGMRSIAVSMDGRRPQGGARPVAAPLLPRCYLVSSGGCHLD